MVTSSTLCGNAPHICCRRQLSCADGGPRCAGLLLPSLNVHAHHEEPQHHQSFHEKDGGQIVGGQIVSELRWQKGQPTQTRGRRQSAPDRQPHQQEAKARPTDCFGCSAHPAYAGSPAIDWCCAIRGLTSNNPSRAARSFGQACRVFETPGALPFYSHNHTRPSKPL